mmetsp:Transcript_35615/g.83287  ORF Transcript_35615/g.83287 Transcript_35615/m.83287 type:complete len:943 (-) Transcript_35615:217-3045(-)
MGLIQSCCCQKPACPSGGATSGSDENLAKYDAVESDWDSTARATGGAPGLEVIQKQVTSDGTATGSMYASNTNASRGARHKDRIGRNSIDASMDDASAKEKMHLLQHKKPRQKDKVTVDLLMKAMQQDRVCANFEAPELTAIMDQMEFYEFAPTETVVTQGEQGSYFFVLAGGKLQVSVNGKAVNTLSEGMCFGSLALLYNCPRTATVVATETSGIWGVSGEAFKRAVEEHAQKHAAEHLKFLDSISMFDGLSAKQKTHLGQALSIEHFDANSRVVTEGEAVSAIYFVKKGSLNCYAGATVRADGTVTGGKNVAQLRANDSFGERYVLYKEAQNQTVVAETPCELFTIGVESLKEALGNDLAKCLEQSFILSGMRNSPTMSQFSSSQQHKIMLHTEMLQLSPGEDLSEGMRFVLVVDGCITDGKKKLERGQSFGDDTLMQIEESTGMLARSKSMVASGWVADKNRGARVAVLTHDGLGKSLKELGLSAIGSGTEVMDYTRKLLLVRKVHIFRHLSSQQINALVNSFVLQRYTQGASVIKQGEMGTAFYVIAAGEVTVSINSKAVRSLSKNAYFGERALLFDEPRTATIEVTSSEAELWLIEKHNFTPIVRGKMLDELVHRIKLQDTGVTLQDLKHVKLIGAGAAGVVRLVQHKSTKMRYALKRVHKQNGKIPAEVTRECALLAANDHPFVMHLVKNFETPKSVYILTELITGGELHAAIRSIPTVLSQVQAQFYTGSLVLVLESLQDRNIVYRDLKPENVMLDAQGYLKLIDFGIAKKLEEGKTRTFTMIGTPHYMAPEVMRGHGYGTEVDIWSLGVMQFEFVCGLLPFADELDDPTEVCTSVLRDKLSFPNGYKDEHGRLLIQGMLSRDPKKRLGAGMNGYEDIKKHSYFNTAAGSDGENGILFQQIMGRELDPPVVPPGEQYTNPEELDDMVLSDKDVLG